MEPLLINNNLYMPCPEGFHVMDEQEKRAMTFVADGPVTCLSDPDRHIIITAGYQKPGGLASFLVSDKDAAKGMQRQISESMHAFAFQLGGQMEIPVGREKMQGFDYRYTSQGTAMYAQSYVVKHNKAFYYLHFYTREALLEENFPVWTQFVGELRWK